MDFEFDFIDGQGRHIKVSENNYCFQAWHDGHLLGGLEFSYIEGDPPNGDVLLLVNAHLEKLPGYTGCGIGTAIVEWVAEAYGCPLVVREHDGIVRNDGSHLTGSGPAFAEAMVARKLMYRY
ncbi:MULTISPECIES: hypothetical protein [unclassified Cupriavidus]|uniref:hypothetical protein n=1 Tax=unclassified Cupriavidus TaxID=2640874 RepID=UPI00313B92EC